MKRHDKALDELALRQHGVVTRVQAEQLGLSREAVSRRLRSGHLQPLTRGVFLLRGRDRSSRAIAKAATLALPGAIASHETAAELHGFSYVPRGRVVVTAPRGTNHRTPLAQVHEYRGIEDAERTEVDGIPLTTRALTIFHLAAVLRQGRVERVLDDQLNAKSVGLPDLYALSDFWSRRGFPGSKSMRWLLLTRGPGFVAPESALEAAFTDLIRHFGLPQPVAQFPTPWDPSEGRVDFAYPQWKILIEVDGRRWHGRDIDHERDRSRDRKAQLAGWIVLRYTWHEVTRLPEVVAEELRQHIDARSAA